MSEFAETAKEFTEIGFESDLFHAEDATNAAESLPETIYVEYEQSNEVQQTDVEAPRSGLSYLEREETITLAAKKYSQHPEVQKALLQQRTRFDISDSVTSLQAYLNYAGSFKLLDDDEKRLAGHIEQGLIAYETAGSLENIEPDQLDAVIKMVAARQVMFSANLRLVVTYTKQFWHANGMQPMDIVKEGCTGLMRAIARFDAGHDANLATYSKLWIRKAVLQAVADQSRLVRIPVHLHEQYVSTRRKLGEFIIDYDRYPNAQEAKEETGMSMADLHDLMRLDMQNMPSLDAPVTGDSELILGDTLVDQHENVEEHVEALLRRELVTQLLAGDELDDREKFVIGLRFAIPPEFIGALVIDTNDQTITYQQAFLEASNSEAEMTLAKVGELLGLKREPVRRIQIKALQKLKDKAQTILQ